MRAFFFSSFLTETNKKKLGVERREWNGQTRFNELGVESDNDSSREVLFFFDVNTKRI